MLTHDRLKQRLRYNRRTGVFSYRQNVGRMKRGVVAGTINAYGYRQICIDGRLYRACRLAWLYVQGDWPQGQVDHRNGVRHDDRFRNLRDVTHAENQQNCKTIRANNTSGVKGVSWCKRRQRWQAHIQHNGVQKNLGVFKDIEKAAAAYRSAEKALHIKKGRTKCPE